MKAAYQRWQYMTILCMKIITGTVEISRHDATEIGAVLAVVALAQLDAGNLSHRIGFIGRLERTAQKILLAHRLRRTTRIDAGRSKKQQTFYLVAPSMVDYVGFYLQIGANKFCRIAVVGMNSSNAGCCQIDGVNIVFIKKRIYLRSITEIKFLTAAQDQLTVASFTKCAHQSGTDHPAMTCNKDTFHRMLTHDAHRL